jgi:cell division protein FtsB
LWIGETGWLDVWKKEKNLHILKTNLTNDQKKLLEIRAKVKDFRDGYSSIEEKARYEMGMIKPNERFLQLIVPKEKQNLKSINP